MALPPRPAACAPGQRDRISSARRRHRAGHRHVARVYAEMLVSIFNDWAVEGGNPAKLDFRVGPPSALQLQAFEQLVERLVSLFRRVPFVKIGSGRGSLMFQKLLDDYINRYGDVPVGEKVHNDSNLITTACLVDPNSLRLPDEAGKLCTSDMLPPHLRQVFDSFEARVLDPTDGVDEPRPCFMVPVSVEPALRDRLIKTGMAVVMPESQLACRSDGRPLLNGCFAVPHRKGQRAIFDARPANSGELRLPWTTLPCGPMFVWARLKRSEALRGSGDDLENYFYQLSEAPEMVCRRGFGRRICGAEGSRLGVDPDVPHRLALRVLAMGSSNAPDVAQAVHEHVLGLGGCLEEGTVLRYRHPLPAGDIYEGIYLDDHLVVGKVPIWDVRRSYGADRQLIEKSHAAYETAGIVRSKEKGFGFSVQRSPMRGDTRFLAWGTLVDGLAGFVRAPENRSLELMALVQSALHCKTTSKSLVMRILGLLVHPLMHLRVCTSALQTVYTWCNSLSEGVSVKWPRQAREELMAASLLLLVAEARLRDMISPVVTTTDATPSSGGSTWAIVDPDLADFMFDYGEHRGERGRLDWSASCCKTMPTTMSRPTEFTRVFLKSAPWHVGRSRDHGHVDHVNIQEMREIVAELQHRGSLSLVPERIANVSDSRVAIGAWAKGRSSSRHLNRIIRSAVGYVVVAKKSIVDTWCQSEDNPSDDPSRFVQLRDPISSEKVPYSLINIEVPGIVEVLTVLRESGPVGFLGPLPEASSGHVVFRRLWDEVARVPSPLWGRELFAGKAGLTDALIKEGVEMRRPMEAYPGPGKYIYSADLDQDDVWLQLFSEAIAGFYRYVHIGIPCGQWSALSRLNGSSRTLANPDGLRPAPKKEALSLEQARRISALCLVLHLRGSLFSIENPHGSLLFVSSPFSMLKASINMHEVVFDQCMYDLRPPGAEPHEYIRKRTMVWANFPQVLRLARACPGPTPGHQHIHALGNRSFKNDSGKLESRSVAISAGQYPPALCARLARLVAVALQEVHRNNTGRIHIRRPGSPPRGRVELEPRSLSA